MLRLSRREPSYLYHTVNYDDNMKKYVIDDEKLLNEWIKDKNLPLTPEQITIHSNKRVWWKCDKGHEWVEQVNARARGYQCPYCSNHRVLIGYNDLESIDPFLASQWDYEKNYPLTPKDITKSSGKKSLVAL